MSIDVTWLSPAAADEESIPAHRRCDKCAMSAPLSGGRMACRALGAGGLWATNPAATCTLFESSSSRPPRDVPPAPDSGAGFSFPPQESPR